MDDERVLEPELELELLRAGLLAVDGETGEVVPCRPRKRELFAALYSGSPRRGGKTTRARQVVDLLDWEASRPEQRDRSEAES